LRRYAVQRLLLSAILVLGAGSLAVVIAVAARAAPSAPARTVPCDEIILSVRSGNAGGYRVVLGVISVPPAYRPQVVATGSKPWTHWSKAGLVIRGGSPPVSVSVPKAWRKRAAITWGNNTGIVSALRIAPCPRSASAPWNAYSGGFYLRSRSACVPLIFRVGQRSATVRFGLGRACK
jgi:hypothetical protein